MILHDNPILVLSLVLVAGIVGGGIAKKLGAPSVTGQIILGAILGPGVAGVFQQESLHGLRPLTLFSLGLIAVAVGNHLNFRLLRRHKKRLGFLIAFEATLTPALVYGAMWLAGVDDWGLGLMFAAMAIATAPATVIALIAETKATGSFVKTLVAGVALNNMACIVLFELARSLTQWKLGSGSDLGSNMLVQLLGPLIIGIVAGLALIAATRRTITSHLLASASIVAILLTTGLAEYFGISPLLSCLFLGMTLANVTPDKDEIGHQVFGDFEHAIFAVFFTLAGMELDFAYLIGTGLFSCLFVTARFFGKWGAANLAMRLTNAPAEFGRHLGLALVPQAGVAIGLVFAVQADPAMESVSQLFLAVGVTAVTLNEIVGPLTTRFALRKCADTGQKESDWIDFLSVNHIDTELGTTSIKAAVTRLAALMVREHVLNIELELLEERLSGSLSKSAYLGHGLSVPHGIFEGIDNVHAVMGISREGVTDLSPDGEHVHCVVLLAIPERLRARRMEIVTAFAWAIGSDRSAELALHHARDPKHAFELLHTEQTESFNTILEKLNVATVPPPRK